ncbi:hypothetical protein EYC80_003473 [Monilinia laxa]|uniref:Transmembrane protein n=1 Tax=Monilinia laxa TaxID=61186 RepID=A0A5N6KE28_MONLA|nr:hypothetical protein EYC80_003473 [Monilinia laxa]
MKKNKCLYDDDHEYSNHETKIHFSRETLHHFCKGRYLGSIRMKGKRIILMILLLLHFALVLFSVSLFFPLWVVIFFFSCMSFFIFSHCTCWFNWFVLISNGPGYLRLWSLFAFGDWEIDHLVNVSHRTDGMDAEMNQENQKVYLSLDGWGTLAYTEGSVGEFGDGG